MFVLQNWWFEFIPKTFCKIEIGQKHSNVLKRFVKSKLVRNIRLKFAPFFFYYWLVPKGVQHTVVVVVAAAVVAAERRVNIFVFAKNFQKKREKLFLEKIIVKKICQILLLSPWLTSVFCFNSKFRKFLDKNTKYFFLYRKQPKPWYMT